jgi:DNA-binding MarR family transcriptional regulator
MQDDDYLARLGPLALASRLRRLLHGLHVDGERVYRVLNVDFKPKWFPILHLLSNRMPLTVTEISRLLCISHPSAIAVIDELTSVGLVGSRKSNRDGRVRELFPTDRGKRLCRKLRPVWDAFRIAGENVNKEGGNDFLKAVGTLERALDREPMYDRVMARIKNRTGRKKKGKQE